jgi:hypothetical protein
MVKDFGLSKIALQELFCDPQALQMYFMTRQSGRDSKPTSPPPSQLFFYNILVAQKIRFSRTFDERGLYLSSIFTNLFGSQGFGANEFEANRLGISEQSIDVPTPVESASAAFIKSASEPNAGIHYS